MVAWLVKRICLFFNRKICWVIDAITLFICFTRIFAGYAIAGMAVLLLLFPFSFYPGKLPVSPQKQAEVAEIEILMERKRMV